MGRYARLAEDYWRKGAPDQYRALRNPKVFFAELETEAQLQIDAMVDAALERAVEGETFMQRANRVQGAQATAEEIVKRELLSPPPPEAERLDPATGIPLPEPETPRMSN